MTDVLIGAAMVLLLVGLVACMGVIAQRIVDRRTSPTQIPARKTEHGWPEVFESWNLVCTEHPSTHYAHAGFPTDPAEHLGYPCAVEGCTGTMRPREPSDHLVWTLSSGS